MFKLPEPLLIENEIDRYKIGDATRGLKYNDDGSLDIYIQKAGSLICSTRGEKKGNNKN